MDVHAAVDRFASDVSALETAIGARIVGQRPVVEGVVDALLAGGHVLLEGVPGLGKTALVRALAEALDLTFSRVQFTPDLMPADITGTNIIVEDAGGGRRFEFQPGPVFANILLADEINRATPKTQSALLEAMQDRSVTVGRHSHELAPPFFVLATQNPVELEGTYPLPEAQLDRFLFKLRVGAPSREELHAILDRTTGAPPVAMKPILDRARVLELQRLIREVPVARPVQDFAVRLIEASHPTSSSITEIRKYLRFGSSPRGAQAIMLAAKVRALRERRFSPSFADVRAVATPSLRHRLLLNFDGEAEAIDTDVLVATLLDRTPEG
jgi:MoxR-like ATPase